MWLHILHETDIHTYHKKCHKHGGSWYCKINSHVLNPYPFLISDFFLQIVVVWELCMYQNECTEGGELSVGYAKRCTTYTCSMTAVDKSEWITMFLEKMCVSK